ncbi:MAG TPA: glycosyltransferase family 39 protein [Planctomycetota bacterium]|jgi:4-amino-4-deoxy-L-arabinose transferase-like glycosyltransferase|nr:glycosyltransferase family 39 protein [Planctomycetota bacterium]
MPSRSLALVGAIVVPLLLLGIFDHELWTPDEPRAAELSREFLEPGHSWAVPTLNGEPFLEKPPLVYWASAASMKTFGVSAAAARLPCLLFGIGTLVFTGLLGRSLYGEETGRGALLILSTTAGFLLVSHHLESVSGLVCFCAGAAYFLHRALAGSPRWYVAFHACLLGAFFSKGPIALVFLGLLLATWVAWTGSWKTLQAWPLWGGLPILIVPVGLWLWVISRDPRQDLLHIYLADNQLGRFWGTAVHLGHRQPYYYYAIQFPAQSAPWILAFLILLPRLRGQLKTPEAKYLLSWLLPGLLFLTASATKRGIYAIPLLPPLAILTARGLVDLGKGAWIPRLSGALTAALVVAALVVIPRVEPRKSLRPFGEALARWGPDVRLCALDPDETTQAVIPFYAGRRVEAVTMSDLEGLSRSPGRVVLVAGPGVSPDQETALRRLFPEVSWSSPPDHSRSMLIVSNGK